MSTTTTNSRPETTGTTDTDIEQLGINTVRLLAADAVQKANSGHPGAPMGMADIATVLFKDFTPVRSGYAEAVVRAAQETVADAAAL